MTVATVLAGLVPVMWATGAGAAMMRRMAGPMIGGILTSFVLELLIYPAIYEVWKASSVSKSEVELNRELAAPDSLAAPAATQV